MDNCCKKEEVQEGQSGIKAAEGNREGRRFKLPKGSWFWLSGGLILAGLYALDIDIKPSPQFAKLAGINLEKEASGEKTGGAQPIAVALAAEVVPEEGYTVDIVWGDTGKKLVEAGGIDMDKYRENYGEGNTELLSYLTETKREGITINKNNAHFWVNTLWALGLTQKSTVLEEGVMGTDFKDKLGNFASTGGWTLGARPAVQLYSSADLMPLTKQHHDMIMAISGNVYRPCCGNSTAFPDCNHGMAALGLIELMASQGASENEIYEALLAFNSFWFSDTYMDLAYYFQTKENTAWADVDPKLALGGQFSSSQGYKRIKQQIGSIPGTGRSGGSSCSA